MSDVRYTLFGNDELRPRERWAMARLQKTHHGTLVTKESHPALHQQVEELLGENHSRRLVLGNTMQNRDDYRADYAGIPVLSRSIVMPDLATDEQSEKLTSHGRFTLGHEHYHTLLEAKLKHQLPAIAATIGGGVTALVGTQTVFNEWGEKLNRTAKLSISLIAPIVGMLVAKRTAGNWFSRQEELAADFHAVRTTCTKEEAKAARLRDRCIPKPGQPELQPVEEYRAKLKREREEAGPICKVGYAIGRITSTHPTTEKFAEHLDNVFLNDAKEEGRRSAASPSL